MSGTGYRLAAALGLACLAGCAVRPPVAARAGLENGGFEAYVMPPAWEFVADAGVDWAGRRMVSTTGHIHRIAGDAAEGEYFLGFRGIGPATLASRRLPYAGETLSLSGRVAARELHSLLTEQAGLVQLVGFDAAGRAVEWADAVAASGTFPWRRFQFETRFSDAVQTVSIWLRTTETARGEFDVDELKLNFH